MSIQNSIICKYKTCRKEFVMPLLLTCCGESICKDHLNDLYVDKLKTTIKCCYCQEQYKLPKRGLPINKLIQDLIEMNLGETHKQAKLTFQNLQKVINKYDDLKKDPDVFIEEYFARIRKKIISNREEVKHIIDEYYETLLGQLENHQAYSKARKYRLNDLFSVNFIKETNYWMRELKKLIIDDSRWQDMSSKIFKRTKDVEVLIKDIQSYLLNNKNFDFKRTLSKIDNPDIFGKIVIEDYSIQKSFDFISCSNDHTIKLWDLHNQSEKWCIQTLVGHYNTIYSIRLFDNVRLLSCSGDNSIKIWNINSGECLLDFECLSVPLAIVTTKSGEEFVSGHGNGDIVKWNIHTEIPLSTNNAHEGAVCALWFLEDKNEVISYALDKTFKIWDIDNMEVKLQFSTIYKFKDLKLIPNENRFFGVVNKQVYFLDFNNEINCVEYVFERNDITCIELFDSDKLVTGSSDGFIIIWDLHTKEVISSFDGQMDNLKRLKIKSNRWLIIYSSDCVIKVWDLNSLTCIQTLDVAHSGSIYDLEVNPFKDAI